MDASIWIYLLMVVLAVMLLSLFFIIYKRTRKSINQFEPTIVKESGSENATDSGVDLREHFRVDLHDVSCFVEFLDVDNEDLNPKFFNGVLKNISVGGVKLVCDIEYPVEADMKIKIRFSLKDNMFIVKGRIVRKELYPESDLFGYGIQFTSLMDEDRELMYRILNRIMVEKRQGMVTNRVTEESMG